jgi:hypothetical protein
MEKQPVDDLFARKLREAETPVNPDVFGQLQKRMAPKPLPVQRSAFVWWKVACAACIAIALGYLYRSSDTLKPEGEKFVKKTDVSRKTPAQSVIDSVQKTPEPIAQLARFKAENKPIEQKAYSASREVHAIPQQKDHQPIAQVAKTNEPAYKIDEPVYQRADSQTVATSITQPNVPQADRVATKQPVRAERTVILTIDEAQFVDKVAHSDPNALVSGSEHAQNGLSSLFGKLKQLKRGDVSLAKAAPATYQNDPKNRFGRVLNGVKESLKNETTLE